MLLSIDSEGRASGGDTSGRMSTKSKSVSRDVERDERAMLLSTDSGAIDGGCNVSDMSASV